MTGAYSLDSELKIYSPSDRKCALEKIIEKLGVAGSTDAKCITTSRLNVVKHIYTFDAITRSLVPLGCKLERSDIDDSFYKYLVYIPTHQHKEDKTILLYNTHIYKHWNDRTFSFRLDAECLLKMNDIWESIRIIECSLIDVELDSILKDMYFDLSKEFSNNS